jgi:ribonuclease J
MNSTLKVLNLGSWAEVTQNLFVYETERDILVFDCGVGFPDDTLPEADVLVPDVSYLVQKKDKIRGIVISHGHMDHYGALPFVLPELDFPPIWASPLVRGFIEAELAEFNFPSFKLEKILPDGGSFRVGSDFEIFPFRVNHSVPDSLGFCLQTPAGKIFHVSDFKFDFTPVDGHVFQIQKAAILAQSGVLGLFADSLGATNPGFTSSEREIELMFDRIINESRGQVMITTLSSNISRFQQAIRASLKHNRRIVLVGRSVEQKIKVAQHLGYLKIENRHIVPLKKAKSMPQDQLTYLVAGSYGQSDSALSRIARDEYRMVKLLPGAVVVFSADPAPPGTKETVDKLVDDLVLRGAHVEYYEIQENLHVSGHGSTNDIRLLLSIIKPKFVIPIGGNPRHVRAFSLLSQEMGLRPEQTIELFKGEILEFTPGQARISGNIEVKQRAFSRK